MMIVAASESQTLTLAVMILSAGSLFMVAIAAYALRRESGTRARLEQAVESVTTAVQTLISARADDSAEASASPHDQSGRGASARRQPSPAANESPAPNATVTARPPLEEFQAATDRERARLNGAADYVRALGGVADQLKGASPASAALGFATITLIAVAALLAIDHFA